MINDINCFILVCRYCSTGQWIAKILSKPANWFRAYSDTRFIIVLVEYDLCEGVLGWRGKGTLQSFINLKFH